MLTEHWVTHPGHLEDRHGHELYRPAYEPGSTHSFASGENGDGRMSLSALSDFFRRWFFPGSIEFLFVGLAVGVAMLWGRERLTRLGKVWLTALVVTYLGISTPQGADLLVWGLSREFAPIESLQDTDGATAIVVLAADSNTVAAHGHEIEQISGVGALRVFEAARLHALIPQALVFTSGGPSNYGSKAQSLAALLSQELAALGVPRDQIIVEARSGNTYQHAVRLAPLLRKHGVRRFLLVTSPTHIRRATMTFRTQGLDPIPSPGTMRSSRDTREWGPQLRHLRISQQAIYDYIGLGYYWAKGWI